MYDLLHIGKRTCDFQVISNFNSHIFTDFFKEPGRLSRKHVTERQLCYNWDIESNSIPKSQLIIWLNLISTLYVFDIHWKHLFITWFYLDALQPEILQTLKKL